MSLRCPECLSAVPARDVNVERMVAKCRECDHVWAFDGALPREGKEPEGKPVPMPRGVKIVEEGLPATATEGEYRRAPRSRPPERLILQYRWFGARHAFFLMFALVWDGMLVNFYYLMFSGPGGGPPLSFALFPLIHVAVGVGLTYYALTGLLNETTVTVDADAIAVTHGPLPWPLRPAASVPTAAVKQLFVRKRVHRSKNGSTTRYEVRAVTHDREELLLLKELEKLDQAVYVERKIENHLALADDRSWDDH